MRDACSFFFILIVITSAQKIVVNTPWWPPGTENTSESVGILSYGDVYCTGMMESNNTTTLALKSEISDVTDILHGANVSINELVQCLINTPKNRSSEIKDRFDALLPSPIAKSFIELKVHFRFPARTQTLITHPPPHIHPGRVWRILSRTTNVYCNVTSE
jgi:hypothetical protein